MFRLRYSLRTALVVITVLAVWLAVVTSRARSQRQAVAEIRKHQGHIQYDYAWDMEAGGEIPSVRPNAEPPGPTWLRRLLGEDLFVRVTGVTVTSAGDHFEFLKLLPKLQSLSIEKSTVTDQGLAAIAGQTELVYLWLDDTQISDAGLVHLQGMKRLRYLYVRRSKVTDEGVDSLKRDLPRVRVCYGSPDQKIK